MHADSWVPSIALSVVEESSKRKEYTGLLLHRMNEAL